MINERSVEVFYSFYSGNLQSHTHTFSLLKPLHPNTPRERLRYALNHGISSAHLQSFNTHPNAKSPASAGFSRLRRCRRHHQVRSLVPWPGQKAPECDGARVDHMHVPREYTVPLEII